MDKDNNEYEDIFDVPKCCNQTCKCALCLEYKLLVRLNCNHYVCQEDTNTIINLALQNHKQPKCPFCRENIREYSCNEIVLWELGQNTPEDIPEDIELEDIVGEDQIHFWDAPPLQPYQPYPDSPVQGHSRTSYSPSSWDSDGGKKTKSKRKKTKSRRKKTKSKRKKTKSRRK